MTPEKRLYTMVMATRRLGISAEQLKQTIEDGELPPPLQPNRYDADAIDRLYWSQWELRKRHVRHNYDEARTNERYD